jgi:hypothetical protein
MATIGQIRVDLSANSASFSRDMKKASAAVRSNSAKINKSLGTMERGFLKVQRSASNMAKGMFSLRTALGVVAGTGGLGLLVKNSIEAADSIGKTADKLGITTSALQEYRFAASQSGVETKTLDMALQRFTRRVGEAAQEKGELKDTLKQYNIAVRDSKGQTRVTVDVLKDLADVIKRDKAS